MLTITSYCCSVAKPYLTLCDPITVACQPPLSSTASPSLLNFMSIESVVVLICNHLILSWPLLLLPSIFPSIRIFSSELALPIRWQSIGASASASVFPMNIQGWFSLGLTGLISLLYKGLSRVFSSSSKVSTLWHSAFFVVTSVHDYWKNHSFDYMDLSWPSDVFVF